MNKMTSSVFEDVIRGEIFSRERLEQYATFLARELKTSSSLKYNENFLLLRLEENSKTLLNTYQEMTVFQKTKSIP